ncbi:MAG: hypothetical protein GY710_20875 [Desulfobacteraceae bacterium]|nr:hypothetical protein [Desulfobacteraceae bacterium]
MYINSTDNAKISYLPLAVTAKKDGNDIDFDLIRQIHSGKNAFVGFLKKEDGKMVSVGSFQISELRANYGKLKKHLLEDAYFTINSSYRAAPYRNKKTGFPAIWRKEKHLKYLNACYVDLDVGRKTNEIDDPKNLTVGEAYGMVIDFQDMGLIPPASIIARSGRGLYLMWKLQKDGTKQPEEAFLNRTLLYKNVNRAITNKLKKLAADKCAIDAARILRVPGSINTKTSKIVTFWTQYTKEGEIFTYSLNYLADFFDIKSTESTIPEKTRYKIGPKRPILNPGSCPNRSKGVITLYKKRIEDFLTIEQWLQGFKHGFRRRSITLYGEFLKGCKTRPHVIKKALLQMAKNCDPPYPSEENDPAVIDIYNSLKPYFHSNKSLCKLYGITVDVAESLDLKTIIPDELKKERERIASKKTRERIASEMERKREIRHNALIAVAEKFKNLSVRGFVKALNEMGIKTNRTTVSKELKLLNLVKPVRMRPSEGPVAIPGTLANDQR